MSGSREPVTHEAIMERLEAGNRRFATLEDGHSLILSQQAAILSQQTTILTQLEPLPKMVVDLRTNNETTLAIKDVVDALATVKNIARFAKWVAAPAALLWGAWAIIVSWGNAAIAGAGRIAGGH